MKNLKVLELIGFQHCMGFLEFAKGLQILIFPGAKLTDEHVVKISSLKHLRELDLSENHLVGDKGVAYLSSLTQLEELDLSGTRITDTGVEILGLKLRRLSELKLSRTAILGRSLHFLCDKIVHLELQHSHIEDESLKFLSHLNRLQDLDLSICTGLTDEGARYIYAVCKIKSLKTLNIEETMISTEGFKLIQSNITLHYNSDVDVIDDSPSFNFMDETSEPSDEESFSDDDWLTDEDNDGDDDGL